MSLLFVVLSVHTETSCSHDHRPPKITVSFSEKSSIMGQITLDSRWRTWVWRFVGELIMDRWTLVGMSSAEVEVRSCFFAFRGVNRGAFGIFHDAFWIFFSTSFSHVQLQHQLQNMLESWHIPSWLLVPRHTQEEMEDLVVQSDTWATAVSKS